MTVLITSRTELMGRNMGRIIRQSATPDFILGITQPNTSNTGYGVLGYTPATLADQPQGDLIITTDNTVVEGKRIHGMVQINANNCTIRGCHIVSFVEHTYPGTTHYGLVSTGGTGNVIAYNEITLWDSFDGTDNSGYTPAGGVIPYWPVGVLLTGGSSTVYRNNIHDVNDLTYTTGGTHYIQGNYLHDPMFRTDDGDQSGSTPAFWSHNDGFQCMGGTNHVLEGNSFEMKFSDLTGMPTTANPSPPPVEQVWRNCHGVLIQTHNAAISGLSVTRNWFKYGSVCVRFAAGSFDPGGSVTLTGNRYTPDQGQEFSTYQQMSIDPTTSWNSPVPSIDSSNVYSNDPDTPVGVRGLPLIGNPTGNPFTAGTTESWAYNSGGHTP